MPVLIALFLIADSLPAQFPIYGSQDKAPTRYPIYQPINMVKYPDPKSMVVDWSGAVNKGITDGIDLGLRIRNSRQNEALAKAKIRLIEEETKALKVRNELARRNLAEIAKLNTEIKASSLMKGNFTHDEVLVFQTKEKLINQKLAEVDLLIAEIRANAPLSAAELERFWAPSDLSEPHQRSGTYQRSNADQDKIQDALSNTRDAVGKISTRPAANLPDTVLSIQIPGAPDPTAGKYLGQLSANKYDPNSVDNPHGKGNQYDSDSVNNPYGVYGSPYSTKSVNNPYATDAPKLYDSGGNYRGKLSINRYDPDSISNPYGRYGNPYSGDSINNRFGVGNPYNSDSPNNPYGHGLKIIGEK